MFYKTGWLLGAMLAVMALWMLWLSKKVHGYLPLLGGLSVLGVLAAWREIIRIAYLQPYGYAITDYAVHPDWPSLTLFFMKMCIRDRCGKCARRTRPGGSACRTAI